MLQKCPALQSFMYLQQKLFIIFIKITEVEVADCKKAYGGLHLKYSTGQMNKLTKNPPSTTEPEAEVFPYVSQFKMLK